MAEVFPTRIRATRALSIPAQLGVGVFGGLLPATMVAIGAGIGQHHRRAHRYPIGALALAAALILLFTLPESKGVDLADVHIPGDTAKNRPSSARTSECRSSRSHC